MDDYRDYLAGPPPPRRRSRWPLFFGMVAVFAVAVLAVSHNHATREAEKEAQNG